MAYTMHDRDRAMMLYLEGNSMAQISKELKIPSKTLYNWRRRYEWESYKRVGNIEVIASVEKQLYKLLQDMAENDLLGDPAEVDKLAKLTKVLDRIAPTRQIYNSLYLFMEGITEYITKTQDHDFAKLWQEHIPAIGEYLKKRYAPKDS